MQGLNKRIIFATFVTLLVWLSINSHFLTSSDQWSIKVFENFKNQSIKILLILKRFENLLCNIFIDVNKVQNTCSLRCNLIPIIVCFRGPMSFCYSYKNVVHFFNQNPFANICVCFILYLSILLICFSHFVNFVPTLLGHMF